MKMLNYNSFLLITEKRNLVEKIKKFANVPEIYNWSHKLDPDMSLWIADKVVKELKRYMKKMSSENYDTFEEYLKTGKIDPEKQVIKKDAKKNTYVSKDNLKEFFDHNIEGIQNTLEQKFRRVLEYVNSPLHINKPNMNKLSLDDAVKVSDEWHKEIEEDSKNFLIEDENGEVIMTFPDGYYWLDLQSTDCSDEGKAMGHCANTTEGTTLLSLRRYKQPHVTISWNEGDNEFKQIKGKGNTKPHEKYHSYIVDLICHLGVESYKSEYNRDEDFSPDDLNRELYNKLSNCNQNYIDNQEEVMTEKELRDKYFDELSNNGLSDDDMYYLPNDIWSYIDSDRYMDDFYDGEVDYYSSEFTDRYKGDEDDVREWILDNANDSELLMRLNSNLENDIQEIKDNYGYSDEDEIDEEDESLKDEIEEMNNEIEERKNKNAEELLEDYDIDQLEELLNDLGILEDYVREDLESKYSSPQDVYDSLYGSSGSATFDTLKEYGFMNYFDEEEAIKDLVEYAEESDLRERYNQ